MQTIQKIKLQQLQNIWPITELIVQNVNSVIRWQKVVVCILPAHNANMNFVMAVVKHLRWVRNAV